MDTTNTFLPESAVEREARSEATPHFNAEREFGGAVGAVAIMAFSHVLLYYLWISATYYHGRIAAPEGLGDLLPWLGRMWGHISVGALPTLRATAIYGSFVVVEFLFARILPGPTVLGLPIPEEGWRQLSYRCNGAASWYALLALAVLLHVSGVFSLEEWAIHLGSLLTVSVIFANLVAVFTYAGAVVRKRQVRMSGSLPYDFFMGAPLNPRLLGVDLKMFAEIRISWTLLFLLTLSAAVRHYSLHGSVSVPLVFMVVAHGLYANACQKGEHYIPSTWDIVHEKWGWMLIFWNLSGVPFLYCFNSYFLLANPEIQHSPVYMTVLFLALFGAYYVWDAAQSQKNHYRLTERGQRIERYTFPKVPWGILKEPRVYKTAQGGTLLIDGFWRYARKIHYTADIVMAFTWALACGFDAVLPFFYPVFFLAMILHRASRDERRCAEKYGDDWERYKEMVPYRFIPFLL